MELRAKQIEPSSPSATKKTYCKPVLRVYGVVRQFTQGSVGGPGDGSGTLKKQQSDRAFKTNWVRVGTHPLGIALYLYDYKPEFPELAARGRQFGVMADEVETVMPAAVSMHSDGYRRVDYAMLGIDLHNAGRH